MSDTKLYFLRVRYAPHVYCQQEENHWFTKLDIPIWLEADDADKAAEAAQRMVDAIVGPKGFLRHAYLCEAVKYPHLDRYAPAMERLWEFRAESLGGVPYYACAARAGLGPMQAPVQDGAQ